MTAPTGWWCPNCGHTVNAVVGAQPDPEPPWSLGEDEATYIDIESAIHQHMGHDGQSDEANDWVTDLMSAIAPFIERAVNRRAGAAPDLTAQQQAVIDSAVAWWKTPKGLAQVGPYYVFDAAVAALVRDTPEQAHDG